MEPAPLGQAWIVVGYINLSLWLNFHLVSALFRQELTRLNTAFDNSITQASLLGQHDGVLSRMECATKCVSRKNCFSFFYNSKKRLCQTHCYVFAQLDNTFVTSNGEEYHHIVHRSCVTMESPHLDAKCNRYMYSFKFSNDVLGCPVSTEIENFLSRGDVAAISQEATSSWAISTMPTTTTTTPPPLIPIYAEPPNSQEEKSCRWEGTSPFCTATCKEGWTFERSSKTGGGKKCWTGTKRLCCMEGTNCDIVGTLPVCGSSPSSCYSRSQDFIRSINAGCWTGYKAVCCDFKYRVGCNGMMELCDLRFDQVTLAGSHNSGSGYDGHLYYSSGIVALDCPYRNQWLSFTDQLKLGIRFFDIDLCWKSGRIYNCHLNAYTNTLTHALEQIASSLARLENHNQVIAIRFHDCDKVPEDKGEDLIRELTRAFSGNDDRPGLNDDKTKTGKWPTLREAIYRNKRVFVFIKERLCDWTCRNRHPWVFSTNYYSDTWMTRAVSTGCAGVVGETKQRCSTSSPFVLASVFASYGLCISDMASLCNRHARKSALECFHERQKYGLTVNFITVDDVGNTGGDNFPLITHVADEVNRLNIKAFGKQSIRK